MSRARNVCLAGQVWPAGRMLPTPELEGTREINEWSIKNQMTILNNRSPDLTGQIQNKVTKQQGSAPLTVHSVEHPGRV